jgi:hypothetical protein
MEVGDLGCRQDEGCCAVRGRFHNHVRSDEAGQSGAEDSASKEIPERRLTVMTETVANLEAGDLDEMYDFLVNAEVVEGPPGFREIVAALWPELLHKVKPPISEMH